MPSFFDIQLMLLVEENHAGASTSMHVDSKMLYTEKDRPRGRGERGKSARNRGGRREQGRCYPDKGERQSRKRLIWKFGFQIDADLRGSMSQHFAENYYYSILEVVTIL